MRGMRDESPARAELVVREDGERTILEPHGDWVVDTIGRHDGAIRAVEAIAPIEADIGKPVVTSNQAMVWHALKKLGIDDMPKGYGRLMEA